MYPYLGEQDWVTSYGLALLLALATCWSLARRSARRAGLEPSHVDLLLPLALILGIVASATITRALPLDRIIAGSELVAPRRVRLIPLVLGAMAVVVVYGRVTSLGGRRLLDVFALPGLVALVVQRAGCFFAGCCWGDVAVGAVDLPTAPGLTRQLQTLPWAAGDWVGWAVAFPEGSYAWRQHATAGLISTGAAESLPVHPTQLYEAILLIVFVFGISRATPRLRAPGALALVCLLGYLALRFATEFLRADSPVVLGPLTITQLQCVAVFVAGLAVWRFTSPVESLRESPAG